MIWDDASGGLSAAPDTSLVFINGKVITMNGSDDICQAVSVRGDRIAAVGTNETAQDHAGPDARVVDLKGRVLIPGFIDAHANASTANASGISSTSVIFSSSSFPIESKKELT